MPCFDTGDLIWRRDETWAVTQVLSEKSDTGINILLTLYVSLTGRF
jgi:hypothetical protein